MKFERNDLKIKSTYVHSNCPLIRKTLIFGIQSITTAISFVLERTYEDMQINFFAY